MKKIFYTISLLLLTQLLPAQTLQVSLTGDWEESVSMKLFGYYGVKKYPLDSSATHLLNVRIPDSLKNAVFDLGIYKNETLLFGQAILYAGKTINVELHLQERDIDVRWHNSKLNSLLERYKHDKDSINNRLQTLLGLYSYGADTTSSFYGKLYDEIVKNSQDRENLFLNLWGEHRDDALGDYIRNDYFDLPDFSKDDRTKFMLTHFFDYFNPLDTIVMYSPLYKSKLEDYLRLAENNATQIDDALDQDAIISALDDYLVRTAENEAVQSATLQSLWQKYHYKSMDELTKYLDEEWISTQCHAENDAMLQERLASYKRLQKGNNAPDYEFTAMLKNEEETHHLADFKGKSIVLAFWASWCPHCEEMLPEIKKYTDKLDNTVVVAVGLDDNRKPWLNAIQRYPGWYHIQGKEKWESPWAKAYSIYATPTFYVIDKEGGIVGKANNESELRNLLVD